MAEFFNGILVISKWNDGRGNKFSKFKTRRVKGCKN